MLDSDEDPRYNKSVRYKLKNPSIVHLFFFSLDSFLYITFFLKISIYFYILYYSILFL